MLTNQTIEVMNLPKWRLVLSGHSPGAWNMALDEALLESCITALARGEKPAPIIRFYGWQPACLSLGYAQKVEREVDLEGCAALGVDWVRRPTGGRAILHEATELTYTLVAPVDNEQVGGSVLESYRKISEGLLVGVQNLGITATTAGKEQSEAGKNPATSACFDAPSAYEITHTGRKLIGSAQARRGGVLLQQGTILVTVDVARLFTALKPPLRQTREEAIQQVSARLTSLEQISGRVVAFEEAAQAFIRGLETHFGVTLQPHELSAEEQQLTARLVAEKYTNPDWNFTRQRPTPAFR